MWLPLFAILISVSTYQTLAAATGNTQDSKIVCKCPFTINDDLTIANDPPRKEDYIYTAGVGAHKLHTDAKMWNDARNVCIAEGAHLAIINSKAEEAVLVEMLKKAAPAIKNALNTEQATLGIHDLYKEGEWVTIFDESLYSTGYSNWSSTYKGGQPDNFENRQDCGALVNEGALDDVDCNDKFAFFCELRTKC